MKRLIYIVVCCLFLLSQWAVAATSLVSQDKDWLGGLTTYNSTEGNDFWLTFMNIDMFDATKAENKNIPFEMKVIVSARQAMDIIIAAGNTPITTLTMRAGETKIYEIDRNTYAQSIYLFSSEQTGYQGVHVYAAQKDKDKMFSCFSYCRKDNAANSSRDATLVLPTRTLGREYYIQTTQEDLYSSQFAIVATEDGTEVTITPSLETYDNKTAANTPVTVTLSKGDAYLVASRMHEEGEEDYGADLSNSTICASKPIAVFNGNQQTSIPIDALQVRDYTVEQSLPIAQWGKEFYLSQLTDTKVNHFRITAAYDNTTVKVYTEEGLLNTISLNAGESSKIGSYLVGLDGTEFVIKSNQPVICFAYMSSASKNTKDIKYDGKTFSDFGVGNIANAFLPAWSHRAKSMNFFTLEMDPKSIRDDVPTPQFFYVYIVTLKSETTKIKVDGAFVAPSLFHTFASDSKLAYAHVPVGNATQYHTVETTGEGFVGLVYALTHAQSYYTALGYTPSPFTDSLFITNKEALMSPKSYDLDSIEGHGWYQRQEKEWVEGKERLDTAVVCDSSTVYWTLESPKERPITEIEWAIFDVTDGEHTMLNGFPKSSSPAATAVKHSYHYQFILPEEEQEERHQFFDYEIQVVLHRKQILCEDEEIDTLKSVTRVTRMFNDTMWHAICMGDTLFFFYDSLYTQANLNLHDNIKKDSTAFIATKSGAPSTKKWEWNVGLGSYEFTRHYQSQFGCDSIVTLELFVCDTFRYLDTIHLCDNQDTLFHDHLFIGRKFKGTRRPYPYTFVQKDTTVQYVKFKTDSCGCQKGEDKDKWLDKEGNIFDGCDSIYQLLLYLHPSYDTLLVDTIDYKVCTDSVYHWQIEREGVAVDFPITKDTWGMTYNYREQAYVGMFSDTLRTKTCSECNDGNPQGCDSINSLKLYIPPAYHFEEDTVWCRIHYDWNKHDTVFADFKWLGHHHDTVLSHGGDYYDSCLSRYGVDSIYHLHLVYSEAEKPLYNLVKDTVCRDTAEGFNRYTWVSTDKDHLIHIDTIPIDSAGYFYYVNEDRCDSIYALELLVLPTYFIPDTARISQEEVYKWSFNDSTYGGAKATLPYDSLITSAVTVITRNPGTKPIGGHSCDSIHQLVIYIGNVYRDTLDAFACGEDTQYEWYGLDHEGNDSLRMIITDLPAPGTTRIYEDAHKTSIGNDSVFYLNLYRAPAHYPTDSIRVCQTPGGTFSWTKHEGHKIYDINGDLVTAIPAERVGFYVYTDTLHTSVYGCDSIWTLHLYVDSVYAFDYEDTGCQGRTYTWPDQDPDSLDRPISTLHAGDFTYTATYHTIYGCDSVWTLHLHIDTAYSVPVSITDTFMCDKDSIVFIDRVYYGSQAPTKPEGEPGIEVPEGQDSIVVSLSGYVPSSLGCDSMVEYRLTVFKTYYKEETVRVCQPSEGRDSLYHWIGHDTVWDVHNSRLIPADSIPRYVKGDTTYTYIDSLRTSFCTHCDSERGGCDSIFILYLTIDSTYHFYDTVHICENEWYEWQGRRYVGDSVPVEERLPTDIIYKPDVYDERIRYDAVSTCDSIYYLQLHIHPVYHTILRYTYCDNDTSRAAHFYTFEDSKGYYKIDTVRFSPHGYVPESDTSVTHYETLYDTLEHKLKTIDGCDSLVTIYITVQPTYEFLHRVSICHMGTYEWRGREYNVGGHYHEQHYTSAGHCDSIFTLELFIKPVHTVVIFDTICDNETYWFRDTLRYIDDFGHERESITEYPVWSPGDPWPKPYVETVIKSQPPDICDSIRYQYYLTICNTYSYESEATLCSGKPFEMDIKEGLTHTWQGTAFEFDTGAYVAPFDSIFRDSLQTVMGCDSVFSLFAHVLPAYRHVVYDTICENETYSFREHTVIPEAAGDTVVRDSLTTIHDCDSIYELRLFIYPKYYEETYDTICADDTYEWQGLTLENIVPTGDRLFVNHLYSVHGCDSIFHLYLHVLDTTSEVNFDTICLNDTLVISQTGHAYTEPGSYKDTTLNEWGCHHFIYTNLAVIPPTVPTLWADDPMCQSESAFDLYYTYTSHRPIAYSLYFDSIGQSMGFEDMIDVPVTEYTDPMVITVPIPYRGDDPTQYPRPDNYSVRLVLDNGFCLHKDSDCFHDSTFVMSYPKWVTEQRFGDVIAILNDRLNGGYTWSAYQWYKGDTELVGETKSYLYVPTGLTVGEQYHVRLTREGDTVDFPTCPITITADPVINNYTPSMGYLAVTPTCVVSANPYVYILSRKGGTYRITTSQGNAVSSGSFDADATQVQVPATAGMYIVQLWSPETQEEPYRAVKIVVKDKCECATSF